LLSDLQQEPYRPFPSFADWAQTGFLSEAFDTFASTLLEVKKSADADTLKAAVEMATRWAAIDTGAIEGLYEVDRGFTFSVAAGAAALENIHHVKGEQTARAIADALRGYEIVLDAATARSPLSEMWIRQLHEVLCNSQEHYTVLTEVGPQEQDLPKGEYKKYPNNPLNLGTGILHSYAPVSDTGPEMYRLISEIRSEAFTSAHPVIQASYAHYAFVCIHPFADGNGRVSRALASVFLYRNPGIPLVIFADQKNVYIDALEAADQGNYRPFVQFIADNSTDTIQLIRVQMRKDKRGLLSERLESYNKSTTGRGGLKHKEVDEIASQVVQIFLQALEKADVNLDLPPNLSTQIQSASSSASAAPGGYRIPPRSSSVYVTAQSAEPAKASQQRNYAVAVAKPEMAGADYVIFSVNEQRIVAEVFLREVHPTVSGSLHYRLEIVAEDELAGLMDLVIEAAQQQLRQQGYLA
jgi:Fic family protein